MLEAVGGEDLAEVEEHGDGSIHCQNRGIERWWLVGVTYLNLKTMSWLPSDHL